MIMTVTYNHLIWTINKIKRQQYCFNSFLANGQIQLAQNEAKAIIESRQELNMLENTLFAEMEAEAALSATPIEQPEQPKVVNFQFGRWINAKLTITNGMITGEINFQQGGSNVIPFENISKVELIKKVERVFKYNSHAQIGIIKRINAIMV